MFQHSACCAAGVLVHCGAGVSRSATLCMAYLMRRFGWNATKARTHCHDRRSLVNPNHGFWQALCAFEPVLGITDRWVLFCCKGLRPACFIKTCPASKVGGNQLCWLEACLQL